MSFIDSYNPHLLDGVQHVHFIGCGGSGTYPLIQILHSRGLTISGSDVEETKITKAERAMGVTVYLEHDAAHLGDAQLVVYSAAIHDENPELKAARARGIPAVERSVMLGYVSRMYSHSVCVSGTHGKTTPPHVPELCVGMFLHKSFRHETCKRRRYGLHTQLAHTGQDLMLQSDLVLLPCIR